jgi:sugar fermentation stimulation protein A
MVLVDLQEVLGPFTPGTFVRRLNRFVVEVEVDGQLKRAHLSDTGRLKELLLPSSPVLLAPNPKGKLNYKFVAVKSGSEWVLLNTSVHSLIASRLFESGALGFKPQKVEREVKFGESRIDFLLDEKLFLEVKGCNLVVNRRCLFPDAPTARGAKHLKELLKAVESGKRAALLFLCFRECSCFSPNSSTDPNFSALFYSCLNSGITVFAARLKFTPSGKVIFKGKLKLCP